MTKEPALPRPIARLLPLCGLAGLLLAGCKVETHDQNGQTATARISLGNLSVDAGTGDGNDQSLAINVPGFSANVRLPDLNMGSDMKIENMKMFPGTRMTGMKVAGDAGDESGHAAEGNVEMRFIAPASPPDLVGYYKAEAQRDGWTAVPSTGDEQFAATRSNDHGGTTRFGLHAEPGASGSSGRFTVTGRQDPSPQG